MATRERCVIESVSNELTGLLRKLQGTSCQGANLSVLTPVFLIPDFLIRLSPAWWLQRGARTRSHPELGR